MSIFESLYEMSNSPCEKSNFLE